MQFYSANSQKSSENPLPLLSRRGQGWSEPPSNAVRDAFHELLRCLPRVVKMPVIPPKQASLTVLEGILTILKYIYLQTYPRFCYLKIAKSARFHNFTTCLSFLPHPSHFLLKPFIQRGKSMWGVLRIPHISLTYLSHISPIISPLTLRLHEVESTHLMYIHERIGGMMGEMMGGICEGWGEG